MENRNSGIIVVVIVAGIIMVAAILVIANNNGDDNKYVGEFKIWYNLSESPAWETAPFWDYNEDPELNSPYIHSLDSPRYNYPEGTPNDEVRIAAWVFVYFTIHVKTPNEVKFVREDFMLIPGEHTRSDWSDIMLGVAQTSTFFTKTVEGGTEATFMIKFTSPYGATMYFPNQPMFVDLTYKGDLVSIGEP